jgi:hypothetical protein
MRIGYRMSGLVAWTIVVAVASLGSLRAAEPERVRPVPLGGTLAEQTGDRYYGVYVPTKFGGVLSVKSTSGAVESITGPEGRVRQNDEEVGENAQGWFTFRVTGAEKDKPYTVETTFVQVGKAARMPWNFYYWPTKADAIHEPWAEGNARVDSQVNPNSDDIQVIPYGDYVAPGQDIILAGSNGLLESRPAAGDTSTWFPNLYDDLTWQGADGTLYQTPSPFLKYDQIFGSSARVWEASNSQNKDIQRWPGHCLGGAIASITMNEPNPVPGSGMTKDELKALWAELGENHLNHRIGDNANNIPVGPPRPGFDSTDASVPRFHAMLETHLRGRHQALLGNLRAFPPTGKPNEVWNHGIGQYTAKMHAMPGEGARRVRIELELIANSGSNLNEGDPKPRVITYEYIVVYGANGLVDETATALCDWISVGGEAMFCPLNLMEVQSSTWQGHNPYVTEANVRSVDLANGGGGYNRKLAGAPPTFRPVGSYEVARAFGRNDKNGNSDSPSQPRRGLFRIFGRN